MKISTLLFFTILMLFFSFFILHSSAQGTWTAVNNWAPDGSGGTMLLLSDGSVLAKSSSGGNDGIGSIYDRLTPDAHGSYINGTWSQIAPMSNTRLYYSTQVLMDGRVYVAGGEYGTGTTSGEVYDPLTNTWTNTPSLGYHVGDANSKMLPDGRVLQALVAGGLNLTTIYDPIANAYTAGPNTIGIHDETTWIMLPDSSILFVDLASTSSERYIPSLNQWIADATVPVPLYDPYAEETGAAIMLPDGRAFFMGNAGYTAYYTPSGTTSPGAWAAGPDVPNGQGTPDAPMTMMANGKILTALSPESQSGNLYPYPTAFYEFDYLTNTFTQVGAPGGGSTLNVPVYICNFLNLPDGTVLFTEQNSIQYFVYTPGGTPLAAGKPTISNITKQGIRAYSIAGTLFNGISEGTSYGDDWQMATNFPIIRLTSGSNAYYARTFNWNSTGVQRGTNIDSTQFTVPATVPTGTYSLVVTANGISSDPISITIDSVPIATVGSNSPVCNGGTLNLTSGGGASYSWTGPNGFSSTLQNPSIANVTSAVTGTYSVAVTGNNGYTVNAFTSVTLNTPPANAGSNSPVCQGSTLNLTSGGGNTYSWRGPNNYTSTLQNPGIASVSASASGTYTVIASGTSGCTNTATVSVTVNAVPTPAVITVNSCSTTAKLSTTSTGNLLWSNGATTSAISVSTAGNYYVTATINTCKSAPGTGVATPGTTKPSTPVITVVNNCGSSLLSSTATGSLLWNTGATSSAVTVSSSGTYSVSSTGVNGCTSTAGTGTAAPKAIPAVPLAIIVANNCGNSLLSNASTGSLLWSTGATTSSVTVTVSGIYSIARVLSGCSSSPVLGTASPLTVPPTPVVTVLNNCSITSALSTTATGSLLWSNGATTSSISVSIAGTYSVTSTLNTCKSASGAGVASPGTTLPATPVVTVVNNCGNSVLSTTATGSLLWNTGATTTAITVSASGTYSVTRSAMNGCSSLAGTGMAAPKFIPSAPLVTGMDNCGSSLLSTAATGTLLWSTNATTSSVTVTAAGTYSVSTTINACKSAYGTAIATPLTLPSPPVVTVNNRCNNSTLSTTATGSLLWNNGSTTSSISVSVAGTYSVTTTVNACKSVSGTGAASPGTTIPATPVITVVNNCGTSLLSTTSTGSLLWNTGTTTSAITVVSPGTFSITATAVNGCTSLAGTGTATPKVIPSAPLVTGMDNCGNSLLSTAATGTLLWSTNATTSSVTVTVAGTYSVATTVNACKSAYGTGIATPKTVPSVPIVTVNNLCTSSALSTTSVGSLQWSTGATTAVIAVSASGTYSVTTTAPNGCISVSGTGTAAPVAIPSTPVVAVANNCGSSVLSTTATGSWLWSTGATTSSITVSSAGIYSVTRTVSGCASTAGTGIAAPKAIPPPPVIIAVNSCAAASVLVTTAPGTLLWSNKATTSAISVSVAGTYSVTSTVNACVSTAGTGMATPGTTKPATPAVTVVANNCGNSLLTTAATGSLLWNTGATTSAVMVNISGTYSVTTKGLNGCISAAGTGSASPKPLPPPPSVTVTDSCKKSILTAMASGNLLWNTGATTSAISVSASGIYSVTVQGTNGCNSAPGTGSASPKPTPPTPSLAVVDGCASSTLSTSATGSLLWSTNDTTSAITVATAGTYSVECVVNGCASSSSGTASPKPIPPTPAITVVDSCTNSVLSASAEGSLLWSTNETTSAITVSIAGIYSITSIVNGCASQSTATAAPIAPTPVVMVIDSCSSSVLSTTSTGSLLWSTNDTTSAITVATAGTYSVTSTISSCVSLAGTGMAEPMNCREATPDIRTNMIMVAYPNPAHDKLQVAFNCIVSGTYALQMTDLTGRLILNRSNTSQRGKNIAEIDLDNYARGSYILSITSGQENKKIWIVVE